MEKKIKYFKTYEITDLKDMLEKTTKNNSNKIAFREKDPNGKIIDKTYLEFKEDVVSLSTKLINMGLKDKKIALIGKNSYRWAVSYLASVIVGIVVPIDKESSNENIKEFLNTSKAEAIISDTKYLKEIENKIILIDMQGTSENENLDKLIEERKDACKPRKQRF